MGNRTLELSRLWDRILDEVKGKIGDSKVFDAFLSDSFIYEATGNELKVVVNSALAITILNNKYKGLIDTVIKDVTQTNFEVTFMLIEDAKTKPIETEKPKFFSNLYLNTNQTFDNFVVGGSNREANQASIMIAANPGKMFNPLFIYADSGLGKTHLLHAIGNYIKENNPMKHVLYMPAMDFFQEFVDFIRGEKDCGEDLKKFFDSVDVLLVDDIQMLCGKKKAAETFFAIFVDMIAQQKQIVITSDKSPDQLKDLEDRLITRFKQGLTVSISNLDTDTAAGIIRSKIGSTQLSPNFFTEEVINFLADNFKKSVRDIEGIINRLIFVANLNQATKCDMDLCLSALQNELNIKEEKTKLTELRIISTVADYYNLSSFQLTGKTRTNQVSLPRHIAMYLIRTLLDVSFTKIGQTFGGKDHSTVMSAVEKVEKQLKTDTSLQTAISQLESKLK